MCKTLNSKILFRNDFSPSGEQPKHHILAQELQAEAW